MTPHGDSPGITSDTFDWVSAQSRDPSKDRTLSGKLHVMSGFFFPYRTFLSTLFRCLSVAQTSYNSYARIARLPQARDALSDDKPQLPHGFAHPLLVSSAGFRTIQQFSVSFTSGLQCVLLMSVFFLAVGSAPPSAYATIRTGFASYYTVASCQREGTSGVYTANGERYEETALTAALPGRQFGTRWHVCRTDTQPTRCCTVRVNDSGPGRRAQRQRVVIDLTPAAFAQLAPLSRGRIPITMERIR